MIWLAVIYVGVGALLLGGGLYEIFEDREKWVRPGDPWGPICGAVLLAVLWPIIVLARLVFILVRP